MDPRYESFSNSINTQYLSLYISLKKSFLNSFDFFSLSYYIHFFGHRPRHVFNQKSKTKDCDIWVLHCRFIIFSRDLRWEKPFPFAMEKNNQFGRKGIYYSHKHVWSRKPLSQGCFLLFIYSNKWKRGCLVDWNINGHITWPVFHVILGFQHDFFRK